MTEWLAGINWPLQALSALMLGITLWGQKRIGDKRVSGHVIGLANQILWIVFALMTGSYPTLAFAALYGGMYWRNASKWRREGFRW